MEDKFSAQHYLDMPQDKFLAEAKKLGVDLYGKSRNQQVDAVYNAELRRRQEEAAEREARGESVPAAPSGESEYESYTVPELRDLADERGIDLGGATKKADIIAAIELADDEANA